MTNVKCPRCGQVLKRTATGWDCSCSAYPSRLCALALTVEMHFDAAKAITIDEQAPGRDVARVIEEMQKALDTLRLMEQPEIVSEHSQADFPETSG